MSSAPDGYRIGPARPEEIPALPAIECAAAALFPPEDVEPDFGPEDIPLPPFEAAAAAGRLWVARSVSPEQPVGFALATLVDGSAHLHEMDVLPEHGRRGLGRALIRCVAEWARAEGFPALTLTTFRHLAWNAPFYASAGFVEIAEDQRGPELRAVMAREVQNGLDPAKRVAMRLELDPSSRA